jgi:hypothetical protein
MPSPYWATTNLCGARSVPRLGSAALHSEPERVRPLLLLLKLLGLRAESKGVRPRLLLLLLLAGGGVQVPTLRPVLAAARVIRNTALQSTETKSFGGRA